VKQEEKEEKLSVSVLMLMFLSISTSFNTAQNTGLSWLPGEPCHGPCHAGCPARATVWHVVLALPNQLLPGVREELAGDVPPILQDLQHAGDTLVGADGTWVDGAAGCHVSGNVACTQDQGGKQVISISVSLKTLASMHEIGHIVFLLQHNVPVW